MGNVDEKYVKDFFESLYDILQEKLPADKERQHAAAYIGADISDVTRMDITSEASALDVSYFIVTEVDKRGWTCEFEKTVDEDETLNMKKIAGVTIPMYCNMKVDAGDKKIIIVFKNELPYIEDMYILHDDADSDMVSEFVKTVVHMSEHDSIWRGHIVNVDDDGRVSEVREEFNVSFDDLALTNDDVEDIREAVDSTDGVIADKLEEAGISPARGILMWGPRGTGKTTASKAIITAVQNERTVIISTVKGVEAAFALARKCGPTVIVLDDIDITVGSRDNNTHTILLTTLLTEMDGPVKNGRVLTIATANDIGNIDPALKRAGRFDTQLELSELPVSVLRAMVDNLSERLGVDSSDIEDSWLRGKTPAEVVDYMKMRLTKRRLHRDEPKKKSFGFGS